MATDSAAMAVRTHIARACGDLEHLRRMAADGTVSRVAPDPVVDATVRAITDAQDALAALRDNVGNESADALWERMHLLQGDVDALVTECLALVGGVMLRDRDTDAGMCGVADRLLREISAGLPVRWEAMTVPGEEERTSYRTGVIALRCPSAGFWSLPIAVHELGHFIAQTLQLRTPGRSPRNPVRTVLTAAGGIRSQREELFADFFATYALGTAYPAAALHTRFNPSDARVGEDYEDRSTATLTHPTVDKRAYLMLATLDRLDDSAGRMLHPYQKVPGRLRGWWQEQLTAVGQPSRLTEKSETKLDALLEQFWQVGTTTLNSSRHGVQNLQRLEKYLRTGTERPDAARYGVRAVVSAAWTARLRSDSAADADMLEKRAIAFLHRVMNRQG